MRWTLLLPITLVLGNACTFGTVKTRDNFPALVAQDQPAAPILVADARNPPGRVAHLDFFKGAVSYQPAESEDWAQAIPNLPLKTGDRLWSDSDGRAELHAGATALRLDHDTEVTILQLDDKKLQVGVSRGTVQVRTLGGPAADSVELDTPSGALTLAQEGSARVDVDPYRPADLVQVRTGKGELTAGGETLPVAPGGAVRLQGGDAPWYETLAALAPDPFETWCGERDRREDASESGKRLGRQMIGFQELDGHGKWSYSADFGPVWKPDAPSGWAPYRAGRWLWIEPWGWTWVDAAPWAFAPSHYGRWALLDDSWAWIPLPDPLAAPPTRPVYAPALVAFLGGKGIRGTAPGGDGTAWFPLGPREAYQPAYPASAGYRQGLNPWPAPAGPPVYRNQNLARALTFMAGAAMAQGLPTPAGGPHYFSLGHPTVLGGAPALAPKAGGLRPAPGHKAPQPAPGSPYRALVTRAPEAPRRALGAPPSRFQVATRPAAPMRGEAPLRPRLAPAPPPAAQPEPRAEPAPPARPRTAVRTGGASAGKAPAPSRQGSAPRSRRPATGSRSRTGGAGRGKASGNEGRSGGRVP